MFSAGDAQSLAENIFHVLGNRTATDGTVAASPPDCISALFAVYRSLGAATASPTTPRRPARQSQHS
jgi:hypothetical protein